jgi:putative transposase
MVRRLRLTVPGGTYYIVQWGTAQQPLFTQSQDVEILTKLLTTSLTNAGAIALGYCWLPDALHLCLRTHLTPVGRVLQGFSSSYARAVHTRTHTKGHLFSRRHTALLIDPAQWLLPVIRYLHWLPVLQGVVASPDAYALSSCRSYVSGTPPRWLDITSALQVSQVATAAHPARALRNYLQQPPSNGERDRLSRSSTFDTRVLGDEAFIAQLPHAKRRTAAQLSLSTLVDLACQALGVERTYVLSKSRRRELALARAVIAWHATERGIASLSEVAHRLGRDPSTLSIAIRRYQLKRPELFRADALPFVVPSG